MPNRIWSCKDCERTYLEKEEALQCEEKHRVDKKVEERLHKENKKMVFSKAVKITKNAFDTHGGGVDFDIPKDCDIIILMGNRGGGYEPYKCLLPHQVYVSDLREDFEEYHFEVIYVVGINSEDVFQIVYKDNYGFQRWSKKDAKHQQGESK